MSMDEATSPAVESAWPKEVKWEAPAAELKAREFAVHPGHPVRVRAPWWLEVERSEASVRLKPRVCGDFAGHVVVREGEKWRGLLVASSVRAGVENRWAGAGTALAFSLPAAFLAYFFTPLVLLWWLGAIFAMLWWPATPLLLMFGWIVSYGRRFLGRAVLCWMFTTALAGGLFALFLYVAETTGIFGAGPDKLEGRICAVALPAAALLGAVGGGTLARKLLWPGLVGGVLWAVGLLSLWLSNVGDGPGGSELLIVMLVQTALMWPVLLLAPWVGATLPPVEVESPVLSKRGLIILMLLLVCLPVGLACIYQFHKPSALYTKERPFNPVISFGAVAAPGTILWELPTDNRYEHIVYAPSQIETSPTQSSVYVAAQWIYRVDYQAGLVEEIRPGGWHLNLASSGELYFQRDHVIFAFRDGKRLWFHACEEVGSDLLVTAQGKFVVTRRKQLEQLDPERKVEWTFRVSKTDDWFEQVIIDVQGNIYAGLGSSLYTLDSRGNSRPGSPWNINYFDWKMALVGPANPVIVVASIYEEMPSYLNNVAAHVGATGYSQNGGQIFHSIEPFILFASDAQFAYGRNGHGIFRMNTQGERELLHTLAEKPFNRVILKDGRIYALTRGKLHVIKAEGGLETEFPVDGRIIELRAVQGDQIYAVAKSSAIALQGLPPDVAPSPPQ